MKRIVFFALVVLLFSCEKEQEVEEFFSIPSHSILFTDIENRSTYEDSLTFHAIDVSQYTFFESTLNDEPVDLFSAVTIRESGYYELNVKSASPLFESDTLIQFVILDEERGESEWGLKKFTPEPIEFLSIPIATLNWIYPKVFPSKLDLPVLFLTNSSYDQKKNEYQNLRIADKEATLKYGSGSVLITQGQFDSGIDAEMNGEITSLPISILDEDFTVLEANVSSVNLSASTFYHITSDISISESQELIIPEGCIFKIDEGVNIYNEGVIVIQGTEEKPVVFTCSDSGSYWGGFITSGTDAKIDVKHAIFTRSGYHDGPGYQYGHAKRQALFYHDAADLVLNHVYAIDNGGQIVYQKNNCQLNVSETLVQRAISFGEMSGSEIEIMDSYFADFPEYSETYQDADNDCIYLDRSDAQIINSAFLWAKDDGIDTGGSGGGEVIIDGCYFEGIVHEGIAMSSSNSVTKNHIISRCTFKNNGQGLELGYSSPNHNCRVNNCTFEQNLIGVRYGDNYDRSVDGAMELHNCTFMDNLDKDVWNFVRSEWGPKEGNLIQ